MSYNNPPANAMGAFAKWIVVILGVGAICAVGYYSFIGKDGASPKLHDLPNPVPLQQVGTPTPSQAKPVYEEPTPQPVPQPLPDLDQSDVTALAALKALNVNGLVEMIIPQDILRKFVRAVDILEEGKVIREYRPVASPQGAFVARILLSKGMFLGTADRCELARAPKCSHRCASAITPACREKQDGRCTNGSATGQQGPDFTSRNPRMDV